MILNRSRRRSAPAALVAAAAATALVAVACETDAPPLSPEAPTSDAEVQSPKEELHAEGLKIRVPVGDDEVQGPAYFLDGERVNDLEGIEPDDIERIEVFKGVDGGQIHVFRKQTEGTR